MCKKEKGRTTILKSYVRDRIVALIVAMGFLGIIWAVHVLYSVPLETDLYLTQILLYFMLVTGLVDFYFYRKKYKKMTELSRFDPEYAEKLMEEHLSCTEKQLCRQIQHLTAEKRELIFQQEQKEQEQLDYYTMWVHQIKTPIAAMHLLVDCGSFPEKKDIQLELFRTEQYVDIALQSLRLFHSNSTDYVLKEQPLEQIVKSAVRKFARVFIQKQIRMDFQEFHCQVKTDGKWLQFVLEQLLSNALKYTQQGTVTISLEEEQGKTLLIRDTGMGIAKEDLPRVFDKGFTGYNGRENQKSTGIGLYLCKEILQKLSHAIQVESELGVGTTVKICLEEAPVEVKYE